MLCNQLQQRNTVGILRRAVPGASRVVTFYSLEWDTTKQRARVRNFDMLPGEKTCSATTNQTILVQHGVVGETWWSERRRVSTCTPHVVESMHVKCSNAEFYLEALVQQYPLPL